jgi:transposase
VQRELRSRDPRRPAILARIRGIWRHLPPRGVLLFFDVQPIAVKTYGARRYTSARRLAVGARQKTRGFFYLFVTYDVRSGRTHWAFQSGKSSRQVCQFLRRVRRWYPEAEIWIALDRDSAHPHKSRETRRTMRKLKLHWINLPKASPDDNPIESIFSDIQLMILDNSDDPTPRNTQRRISAHLRGRNRRKDRHIRIPYLPDSHKG